jgi:hypothetical protein
MSKQEAWKCDECGGLMQEQEVNVPQDVRFARGVVIKAGDYHSRCFVRLAGGKPTPVFRDGGPVFKQVDVGSDGRPVYEHEYNISPKPSPEPSYNDDPYSVPTGRGVGPSGPLPPPSLPASRGVRVARKLATR